MSKSIIFIVLFALLTATISSQSGLYIPKEIARAVEGDTRTLEGVPGEKYWQNSSDYKISAEINPDSSLLKGHVEINYFNNSPDSLNEIVLRLYQNIMKPGSLRDWYFDSNKEGAGVQISNLKINGELIDTKMPGRNVINTSTNMIVKLPKLLKHGESLTILLNWEFKIPEVVKIRMGNYGDGDMFIAYWYPQVAVYDDIDGWDMLDYSGSVEFYNDFNNYDFSITLPDNYVVWATGELQNSDKVFHQNILDRIKTAANSDETVKVITQEDYKNNEVTVREGKNTWVFKARNVTDVSFCISDNYNWDAASVEVEPGRRVLTNAVYQDGTVNFSKAAFFSRASIEYLSKTLPGYPYIYPHITTFCNKNNSGGMETPMMANDGAPLALGRHIGLIFHEIAHNYFPFMMGTNERKYAWMDEGWASFFPNKLIAEFDPEYDGYALRVRSYESNAGKEAELPPLVVSYSNKGQARTAAYDRPAVAYNELYELLGEEKFKSALLDYVNAWIGKHPIPIDFFYSFNKSVGEDLSWFWNPWFYEFGYPDLSIDSVVEKENSTVVFVKKIGHLPTEVCLTFEYEDESKEEIKKSSRVWSSGEEIISIKLESSLKIKKIILGNEHIPDVNRKDNIFILGDTQS